MINESVMIGGKLYKIDADNEILVEAHSGAFHVSDLYINLAGIKFLEQISDEDIINIKRVLSENLLEKQMES